MSMLRYLILWAVLALPTMACADAEGMVLIGNTFHIDIYEYPNRPGVLPKVNVTWREAETLCATQGKRLCTEQEWQKACTGSQNYIYSYGENFESGRCNTPFAIDGAWQRGPGLAPSGYYENCANDFGIHDMIGNAWEWTATWYSRPNLWRVVRGGSYFNSVNLARADGRYGRYLGPEYRLDLVGFRCCRSAVNQAAE